MAGGRVEDVLAGPAVEGPGAAVVYDEGDGFWPAYSAAEALAQRGWQVTFVTALTALAPRVPHESVGPLLRRLGDAGVTLQVAPGSSSRRTRPAPLVMRPVFGGADRVAGPGAGRVAPAADRRRRAGAGTPADDDADRDRRLRDPPADQPRHRRGLPARGERLMPDHPTLHQGRG